MSGELARILRIMCPRCHVKLELDEVNGEWYCPNCSYAEEVVTNEDFL